MGKQLHGRDTGRHEKKRRENAQKSGAHHAHARVPFVLGRKHALHDVLTGARVPKPDREKSGEDSRPRKLLVLGRKKQIEFFGHLMGQLGQTPGLAERQNREQNAREQHHHHLQKIGPGRGLHAAVDRVGAGGRCEKDDAPFDVGRRIAGNAQLEDLLDGQPACVQRPGQQRKDVTDDQRYREQISAGRVISLLEKLRHRVQARPHVVRQEDEQKNAVDDPAVPARRRHDHSVEVGDADIGDEVLAADVAGHHRGADDVPGQFLLAEKIVPRLAPRVAGDGESQQQREPDVGEEDGVVDGAERRVVVHRVWVPFC